MLILMVLLCTTEIQSSALRMPFMIRTPNALDFGSEDIFEEVLEEVQDPITRLPIIKREKHYNEERRSKEADYEDEVDTYTQEEEDEEEEEERYRPRGKTVERTTAKIYNDNEKIALYNPNTGNFNIIPAKEGYIALPNRPYPYQQYLGYGPHPSSYPPHYPPYSPYNVPTPYNNDSQRIFWNSVGDVIESTPFLPVQVNVPDMISAMANFFSNAIPFINRWQNPNKPRPYEALGHMPGHPEMIESINQEIPEYPREGPESKMAPATTSKIKKIKGSSKYWPLTNNKNANANKDDYKFKNMPITRKKYHILDRDVFNFKNSDISNSPIMILSMPSRPMVNYRRSARG